MKLRSGAGTRCIISLVWLIADSTAGRWNGFSHLRSEREPGNMLDAYGDVRRVQEEKKRVQSWLLPARFIADFFAHGQAWRRLISSSAEAISVDSKPKLRSQINSLDMTWNRDLSEANWITHNTRFHLYSSRAITDSSGVGWLLATFAVCWLTSRF